LITPSRSRISSFNAVTPARNVSDVEEQTAQTRQHGVTVGDTPASSALTITASKNASTGSRRCQARQRFAVLTFGHRHRLVCLLDGRVQGELLGIVEVLGRHAAPSLRPCSAGSTRACSRRRQGGGFRQFAEGLHGLHALVEVQGRTRLQARTDRYTETSTPSSS
jgi:hypothetical protein